MPGVGPRLGGLLAVAILLAPLHQCCSPLQTHRDLSGREDATHCLAHVLCKMLQCQCSSAIQTVQTQHAILQMLCNLWLEKSNSNRRESVATYIFNLLVCQSDMIRQHHMLTCRASCLTGFLMRVVYCSKELISPKPYKVLQFMLGSKQST